VTTLPTGVPSEHHAHVRALAKAISWRLLGTIGTSVIVFVFTGRWALALSIGGVEFVGKIGLFFIHERLWDRVRYGQPVRHVSPPPDDQIRPSR
jgi:uncharacterized membrane protein